MGQGIPSIQSSDISHLTKQHYMNSSFITSILWWALIYTLETLLILFTKIFVWFACTPTLSYDWSVDLIKCLLAHPSLQYHIHPSTLVNFVGYTDTSTMLDSVLISWIHLSLYVCFDLVDLYHNNKDDKFIRTNK